MSEAVETLSSVMNDTEVSAGTRIKSAQILLDICLRTSEQMDIVERIVAIEESLAEQRQKPKQYRSKIRWSRRKRKPATARNW